jgi:signal transduction histidine kinase/CheY-like chemotaxis protein
MAPSRPLSIRTKLVFIGVGTAVAALMLTSAIFVASTYVLIRRSVRLDLRAQAAILADNIAAAIAFDDPDAAEETLRPLTAKPTIDVACVYNRQGTRFARFGAPGFDAACPDSPPGDAELIQPSGVTLVRGIELAGQRVGTLYIHGNLIEVLDRFRLQTIVTGVSLALGLVLAFVVGRRLQRVISEPLLHLADTSKRISEEHDYTVRARKTSNDEIGDLVDAFNTMLTQVERRNTELSNANAELSREIVERQRMEAERTELLGREREANRLKDEFLAALSHELRTPLNAILGWTQILQTHADAQSTRALSSIERNARSQARMIEDLLDVSRIVSGKFHLKTDVVELVAVVNAALEVVRPAAAAKRIAIVRSLPERPCFVSGDQDRLQQVFWNLLSNAVKFTPAGGRIDVSVDASTDVCAVAVRDTGIGIAPEFLPHVFDRFRQADGSMSREHGGLGLGLAIVRDVVALHGGSVAAQSDGRDTGATFVVRLPRLAHVERMAAPDAVRYSAARLAGVAVLVADDDADAREIAAAVLTAAGARVRTARSAPEALEALAGQRYSVLVCDIGMPEMDGYALIRRVRNHEAQTGGFTPAVAMTAYASESDKARAFDAGFQAHIAKPVNVATLLEVVASLAAPSLSPPKSP